MATPQSRSEGSDEEVFTGFSEEDLPTVVGALSVKVPQHNPEGLRSIWLQGASEENPAQNYVEKASANLKSKMAERDVVIRCLKRQEEFLKNYTEKDAKYVQARLQRVKKCWEDFQELSRAIRSIEGSVSESEDLLDETDERCTQLIGEFEEKLNCASKVLRSTTAVKEERSVRLPRLALPEFSGKFDEWLPFHSLYVSAVHENNALSDAEKIMYLKRALKGDALRVIDAFPTCGSAYDAAWKALIKRYANEYLLKKRYINELLSMPRMKVRGTKEIHGVVDGFERNTKLLDQLGENTGDWGMLLTQLLVSKLDDDTQRNWERFLEKDGKCTVKCLFDFLRAETRVLDAMAVDQRGSISNKKADRRVSNLALTENTKCAHCSNQHQIAGCKSFAELEIGERLKVANDKRLCLNCLAPGHWAAKCFSKNKCAKCQKRHHTLLHKEESAKPEKQASKVEATSMLAALPSQKSFVSGQVMLSTAIIRIKGKNGKWFSVRALLDNGSQINIMTANLCRRLKLSLVPGKISITGIGKVGVQNTQQTKALVSSAEKAFLEEVDFVVLEHITENQPSSDIAFDASKLPKNMVLADPDFYRKGPIDLLLGAEYFVNILKPGCKVIPSNKDHPSFMKTVFGWVASGKTCFRNKQQATCHLVTIDESLEVLTECMERFWRIEDMQEKQQLSQQERDCEEHFAQFYRRDDEGRYVVKLPFKIGEQKCLGKSKECATRRFHQLERRFQRDPSLGREYAAVIADYVYKGFLKKVAVNHSDEEPQQCYYLPHRPVIKVSSTTTKIRPVFDGSSKTTNEVSLNNILLKGPVIQDSLLDQLLRFRMRNYALVADLRQMYLQVKVHEDHTRFQRILWRDNVSLPLETYELQRVTFGLTPSSFLATRVLKQLAIDEGDAYPKAKKALQEDFYVDDFLGGANTEEEARGLLEELTKLLAKGGFQLQKWNSNSTVVLEKIPSEDLASSRVVKLGVEEHVKALGIAWQPDSDKLFIEASIPSEEGIWTRRRVYSMIAKLFDPLGLVSPIVSWAKIQMQAIWIATDTWDEPIPQQMAQLWDVFQNQLPFLKEIKFDRKAVLSEAVSYQFHCFSDASEAAYGACVYMRSTDQNGNVKVEMIAAKSRPAPLKRISLARLELCGAVLATKLRICVGKAMKMEDATTYMWTDSTIVLHWIRSPSYTWATFVANRVSMVQELGKGYKWLHVKGTENPSDIISRGALPKELLASKLWYHGPLWLTSPEDDWKLSTSWEIPDDDDLEKKRKALVIVGTNKFDNWSEKYSHFWKCVKVMAYCLRFIDRCKRRNNKCESVLLSVEEVAASKMALVKMLQREHFAEELGELSKGRAVAPSSKVRKLGAFLDEEGLLRVGGRLTQLVMPYAAKHPLILPGNAHFTKLIARMYHLRTMHGGPRATLAAMRGEYWPLNGRRVVNEVCRGCVTCFKAAPNTVSQPSGQLPVPRATPTRPFTVVGVDFGGPFYLKPVHRRAAAQKCYLAVFVCFAVKAVHLELVEDLSTAAFMAAFRRFVSRRGLPSKVYSDNGLNFRGASNELKELYDLLKDPANQQVIRSAALSDEIEWHFIPPHAPNFGGLWEAAVKSAKRIMKRVLGNQKFSFPEMTTLFAQIEAQMNSRPLTPLSEDPAELNVLTPGHFLIGSPITGPPEKNVSGQPENRLLKYEQVQRLLQLHWKRWSKEYITELHNYGQRVSTGQIVKEGQMVILKEENIPICEWPLGRVDKVFEGPDKVVRVVKVRTKKGVYTRPTSKICILPMEG